MLRFGLPEFPHRCHHKDAESIITRTFDAPRELIRRA